MLDLVLDPEEVTMNDQPGELVRKQLEEESKTMNSVGGLLFIMRAA